MGDGRGPATTDPNASYRVEQSSTAQTVAALATAISGLGAGVTATPGASGTVTVTANQTGELGSFVGVSWTDGTLTLWEQMSAKVRM
jgi:hypothetical protein